MLLNSNERSYAFKTYDRFDPNSDTFYQIDGNPQRFKFVGTEIKGSSRDECLSPHNKQVIFDNLPTERYFDKSQQSNVPIDQIDHSCDKNKNNQKSVCNNQHQSYQLPSSNYYNRVP